MDNLPKLKKASKMLYLIPIIVFSSLVPLVVYTRYIKVSDFISSHWLDQPVIPDIFSFYKMILIIICAIAALVFMFIGLVKTKVKIKPSLPFLIAVLYGILVILSSIFSDYPSIAFWGAPERYEGAIVIVSYMIMFIYTISVVDTIEKAKLIIYSILVSSLIIFIIAVFQFFGYDIYKIDFFRYLINMNASPRNPYDINTIFSDYTSYSTMYNPNNFAFYITLIFPLTIAYYAIQKTNAKRILAAILVFTCLLSLIGSSITGAYYAVVISCVVLLFLAFPYIKRNILNVVMLIIIVAGLLLFVNVITGNRVAQNLNILSVSSEIGRAQLQDSNLYIDNIILDDTSVFIDTTENDFTVVNENNDIQVFNASGEKIDVKLYDEGDTDVFPGNIYYFSRPDYENYVITTNDNYSIFAVKAGLRIMYFHMTEDGIKVPGLGNKLDIINTIERNALLYKYSYIFSGRGYIWSGMLPLLDDTIILGNGPDTTFLTYPQNDYIGKINMSGNFNIVIEKPHNFYLQLAHDTGWLSLLLILILFAYFLVSSFILLIKKRPESIVRKASAAILCGIIGYLIAALMYDSSVITAPVFWTVLALGLSLNKITNQEKVLDAKMLREKLPIEEIPLEE